MKQEKIKIGEIPAILWGESAEELIIAVHGQMSHKADEVLVVLAEEAVAAGYQVLSFDLPEHGERKDEPTLCNVQNSVTELQKVFAYASSLAKKLSVFGCSLGAYFSLLAYPHLQLERAWFLSPVVDMREIIENMMTWFKITEEQLKAEQEVSTPIGQTLYWDYYCYVKEHPVVHWDIPTAILYGEKDEVSRRETISTFAEQFQCRLQILKDSEHFFHTPEQLAFYRNWLKKELSFRRFP